MSWRAAGLLVLSSALLAPPAAAEEVFWTTRQLLKDFFLHSERVGYVEVKSAALRGALRDPPRKDRYVVYVARTAGKVDGYAVVDDEPGEHLPITFGVKVGASGKVERVEVMAYREAYGGEIRSERFRRQFVGRDLASRFELGGDVDAISGATISSRALASGVRRALALVSIARTSTAS